MKIIEEKAAYLLRIALFGVLLLGALLLTWGTAPNASAQQTSPSALTDCPGGQVCFFQHPDWQGMYVHWNNCGDERIFFRDFGLEGKVSSWVNHSPFREVNVYDNKGRLLWHEYGGTKNRYVGKDLNNKAYSFQVTCGT